MCGHDNAQTHELALVRKLWSVCVCVRVCACVPGSLRVRECVLDTSLFCARCKPADEGFRRQGFGVDAL